VWIGLVLLRRRNVRGIALFGLGFLLLAGGNLLYNQLLSGNPLQTPTHYYDPGSVHDRLALSWRGFVVTGARLAALAGVFPPVLLLWSLRKRRPSPEVRLCLALFGMTVAAYFLYPAAVGGPGPRYLLAYFPFLVLAVLEAHRRLVAEHPDRARRISAIVLGVQVASSVTFLAMQGFTLHGRRDLERTLARDQAGPRVVLLKTGTYHTAAGDLTRNPPDLASSDTVVALWCDAPKREALLEMFPGRRAFVYEYPGRLTPYADPGGVADSR
jgi:hypothetical protein